MSATHDALAQRAGRREWIALLVLMLPGFVVAMDLTVLHLAVPTERRPEAVTRAAALDRGHLWLPAVGFADHHGDAG